MQIMKIAGATRTLGKSQGYLGLPVRDELVEIDGQNYHKIVTAWEPTPAEAERIAAGAPIYLELFCFTPPPLLMTVGEAPDLSKEFLDAV